MKKLLKNIGWVLLVIFGLAFLGTIFTGFSKVGKSVLTPTTPSEVSSVSDESAPAPEKRPPSRFKSSHRAIDGVDEAGDAGRDASADVKVAVGKPAASLSGKPSAKKFEKVTKTLSEEELEARARQLKKAKEEVEECLAEMRTLNNRLRTDKEGLLIIKDMAKLGAYDAASRADYKGRIERREETINDWETKISENGKRLKKAQKEVLRLEQVLDTGIESVALYSNGGIMRPAD